ncbi:MAG: DHHA2 domain-containing protein [Patescibacteria group bacterium]
MLIVTSYENPDIDCIACSIGYAELKNKLGISTKAVYSGNHSLEVEFVKNFCKAFPVEKDAGEYLFEDAIVLVDTSTPHVINPQIPLNKVVEIYDHRELAQPEKFPAAKSYIEMVGSCSTLIAELFQKNNFTPSLVSAIYLYSAIISNTVNFKGQVTTDRDIEAADWLKGLIALPDNYVELMFRAKSKITSANIGRVITEDYAVREFGGRRVGIAQIEVADLENLLKELKPEIVAVLEKMRAKYELDLIFFNGIDILKGFNIFMTVDEKSNMFFSEVLGLELSSDGTKTDFVMLRKQIWPKVKNLLER